MEEKKEITLWVSDKKAAEKVAEIVEALDGLHIEWGEEGPYDSFELFGRKGDVEVTIKGYLDREENFMLEISYGTTTITRNICAGIYEDLQKLAREVHTRHFNRMAELWDRVEKELK